MPHLPVNVNYIDNSQGPAGRYFQLRDGSGSGRVSGIFAKRIINRVFLGIENHDIFGYILK